MIIAIAGGLSIIFVMLIAVFITAIVRSKKKPRREPAVYYDTINIAHPPPVIENKLNIAYGLPPVFGTEQNIACGPPLVEPIHANVPYGPPSVIEIEPNVAYGPPDPPVIDTEPSVGYDKLK
jgi:hypothetical protein